MERLAFSQTATCIAPCNAARSDLPRDTRKKSCGPVRCKKSASRRTPPAVAVITPLTMPTSAESVACDA
eukprot:2385436-Pleurochrysis_carterae.AAC.3